MKYVEELKARLGNTDSSSTEELLSKFTEYNNKDRNSREDVKEKFVASMDIASLFPSMRTEDCVRLVKEMISKSKIYTSKLDAREMGIFLRKSLSTKEIEKCEMCDYIPLRKKKLKKHAQSDDDQWQFSKNVETDEERAKLFAEVIGTMVRLVLNNQIYKFGNVIRKQENKGGIGDTLTGILAKLKMIMWNIVFSRKLSESGIENDLHDTFVDDTTLLPTVVEPGLVLKKGKLVYSEEQYKEDKNVPGEMRTMKIVQAIANSIDENIQVTFDVPSQNVDGRVPILDLIVAYNK